MSRAGSNAVPSFDDRLVAECVRVIERDGRRKLDEPAAEKAAHDRGGDFESRIITRARESTITDELHRAIHQLRAGITWIIVIGLLIAFLLGVATVRATMAHADGTRINFYWVLGGVLGVQSILLLIWLIAAVSWRIRLSRATSEQTESPMLVSLGRLVVAIGQWLGTKLQADATARAVLPAAGRVFSSGRIGFWMFSSITHAIWLSFNVGALTLVLLLLSARQYTFVWETTILSERHYVTMTEWLSAPARFAGFAVPTDEDIAMSQWTGGEVAAALPEGASQRWASLLVASIVLYGFGPRVVLLGLSMSMSRRARSAYRLDTTLPGYERLRDTLMPQQRAIGVVDPDDAHDASAQSPGVTVLGRLRERPPGPPAIVGLEITPPDTGWPPAIDGIAWTDLGIIESRDDRRRIVETVQSAETEPDRLVIVADVTNTPDRGLGHALNALVAAVDHAPLLVLSAGQKLRDRGYDADQVAQRIADWRELAKRSGVDQGGVLELDLNHLTDNAAAELARRIGRQPQSDDDVASTRRIESAFAVIEQHAEKWLQRDHPPTESDQLALHREIAGRYRHESTSFRSLLSLKPDSPRELMSEIKTGAAGFVDLLPARLRRSPKWLAAGALAGAFGCVASAAMISPIAIAALPSWSAIGAAVAAAIQPSGSGNDSSTATSMSPDVADAARAATLFAVMLELQGRDETTITRVLDQTFAENEFEFNSTAEIHDWLNAVRHRFDLALEKRE